MIRTVVAALLLSALTFTPALAGAKEDLLRSIILLKNKTESGVTRSDFSSLVAQVATDYEISSLNRKQGPSVSRLVAVAKSAAAIISGNDIEASLLQWCFALEQSNQSDGSRCRPDLTKIL